MRAEDVRVETNAGNPLRDKPSILPGRHAPVSALSAAEHEVVRLSSGGSQVFIDSLAGLLGQLKPDRLASLPLPDRCPIGCITVWGDILDLQCDDIAGAELAIDGQIEHREIACSSRGLKLAPY